MKPLPTKDVIVKLRCNGTKQRDAWDRLAHREGKTLSQWLRDLADAALAAAKEGK